MLMKRRDLMKRLAAIAKAEGTDLITSEGGKHTKVQIADRVEVVPRHTEINEMLAKKILKKMETPK
jgi:mRNA interferase HicA